MNFSKVAIVLLAFTSFPSARAGDYSNAYEKQSRCESAGKLAQSYYGSDTPALRAAAANIEKQVKKKEISRMLGEKTKYILFLGNKAKSSKDAYMSAWAWCMDQDE
jgi:hypothetical protein